MDDVEKARAELLDAARDMECTDARANSLADALISAARAEALREAGYVADECDRTADECERSAAMLRGEVEHGVTLRQSAEAKEARVQVLTVERDRFRRIAERLRSIGLRSRADSITGGAK